MTDLIIGRNVADPQGSESCALSVTARSPRMGPNRMMRIATRATRPAHSMYRLKLPKQPTTNRNGEQT